MKKINYIYLLLFIVFTASCDEIDAPYWVSKTNTDTTVNGSGRKVLVEDYTGHKCGNCPLGHRKLQEILLLHKTDVIPVTLHVSDFARPINGYPEDFRTTEGTEISDFYAIANLPLGMVNRTPYNEETVLALDSWFGALDQQLDLPQVVELKITNSYDSTNLTLSTTINSSFLTDNNQNLMLTVWLTEDSIIATQDDYAVNPPRIADYVHRHVLRKSLSATWGDTLVVSNAANGTSVIKNYSLPMTGAWNVNHCYIVTFVSDADTKEVLQAEEQKVKN